MTKPFWKDGVTFACHFGRLFSVNNRSCAFIYALLLVHVIAPIPGEVECIFSQAKRNSKGGEVARGLGGLSAAWPESCLTYLPGGRCVGEASCGNS